MKAKKTGRCSAKRSKNQSPSPGSNPPRAASRSADPETNQTRQRRANKGNERSARTKHLNVIPGLCLETSGTALSCPSRLGKSRGKRKQENRKSETSEEFSPVGSRNPPGHGSIGDSKDSGDGATSRGVRIMDGLLLNTDLAVTSRHLDDLDEAPEDERVVPLERSADEVDSRFRVSVTKDGGRPINRTRIIRTRELRAVLDRSDRHIASSGANDNRDPSSSAVVMDGNDHDLDGGSSDLLLLRAARQGDLECLVRKLGRCVLVLT